MKKALAAMILITITVFAATFAACCDTILWTLIEERH